MKNIRRIGMLVTLMLFAFTPVVLSDTGPGNDQKIECIVDNSVDTEKSINVNIEKSGVEVAMVIEHDEISVLPEMGTIALEKSNSNIYACFLINDTEKTNLLEAYDGNHRFSYCNKGEELIYI